MKKVLILTLISLTLLFGCGDKKQKKTANSANGNLTLPKFELSIPDSKEKLESKKLEEIIVISFISDFCGPCIKELESIKRIQDTYENKNVDYLILIIGDGTDYLKDIDSLQLKTHIALADSNFLGKLKIGSIPTRLLFSNNELLYRLEGTPSYKEPEFREELDKLLGIVRTDTLEIEN
ncbi:MAG: TlpA family protein disulfide reductase [Candidatus Zixiibacteriota bacterium]